MKLLYWLPDDVLLDAKTTVCGRFDLPSHVGWMPRILVHEGQAESPHAHSVLSRTFVHVPGIGATTEKALWASGVSSWKHFLSGPQRASITSDALRRNFLEQSIAALGHGDSRFFAQHLPRHEWWRLYPQLDSKAVFLDIETTGLSQYYDEITLVGLYAGEKATVLIAGYNLERLQEILDPYDILVTFNGTLFDIPFLKTKFPSLKLPPIHIDLRYLLRKIGYSGGLKDIEKRLGFSRAAELKNVDGAQATVLWARYMRGDISSLERLVKYNISDVTILKSLMQFCCSRLTRRLFGRSSSASHNLPLARPRHIPVRVRSIRESDVSLRVGHHSYIIKTRPNIQPLVTIRDLLARIPSPTMNSSVVGIDLRGSMQRPTGWAMLDRESVETCLLKTDDEIVRETLRRKPRLISIDSPLTLPTGRCCVRDSCECRAAGILRECERTLWRRGVRVFPCLLPSMQQLTERGIRLARIFENHGFSVIESYPGAAQDIMRIPRKGSSIEDLRLGLAAFGIDGAYLKGHVSHDELDAITSALVGYFYLSGDFESLGNERESYLIVPRLDKFRAEWKV